MIVADASAIGDVLLDNRHASALRSVLAGHSAIHVPEHFHVEIISLLRSHALRGELGERRRAQAVSCLRGLRVVRYSAIELLDAVWELRDSLSAYDAAYLALARQLGLSLVTCDGGLAEAARAEGRLAELPAARSVGP
ncbi:MAG: type II toxin-antitoxin system VapC family toxin [Solirubrobacterales bacterium]